VTGGKAVSAGGRDGRPFSGRASDWTKRKGGYMSLGEADLRVFQTPFGLSTGLHFLFVQLHTFENPGFFIGCTTVKTMDWPS
jgi:hypothetical protein